MVERIRDVTVADAIAAEAGTESTPELVLGEVVTPVLQLQPRPPLAISGYLPGTVGLNVAASALNFSHAGCFISGFGGAVGRINFVIITNTNAGLIGFQLRRLDAPFTGFPSVRAVPGYINAGIAQTGRVFSVTKNDAITTSGALMAQIFVEPDTSIHLPGPWVLNDGALLISSAAVNQSVKAVFGYEVWPAIRVQPPG